jgi:uncharacterized protein YodC (DUF2158 family)
MSDTQFKAGDVVTLKSGGPEMTIDDISKYGMGSTDRAKCIWFDGKKKMEDVFELHSLKSAV